MTDVDRNKYLEAPKRAVLYLRVSSKQQMYTATDIDADGNSIATQRETTIAKAASLDADVVKEFVEPGASAKTIEQRPVFKDLLQFLIMDGKIDYVVVYMRSRAFRNHFDAAIVGRQLEQLGVRLVSVKEDFGEGPHAVAMEGFTDVMNGLQNTLSGLDIQTKLQHKAVNGGTIGRARLGYLNARVEHEGRMINTVTIDPKRAPLVLKAWELYSTGDYSIDLLEATMADLGLTTRPSPRWPVEQPVSDSKLHQMLRDPYYTGYVVYKGDVYPGRHEAIVSQELFDRVQDVLSARSGSGQRDRRHHHYLKGILFCERCFAKGHISRLVYTQPTSRSGTKYQYFVCRRAQEGRCDLRHLPVTDVEEAVVARYATLSLATDFVDTVNDLLSDALADSKGSTREMHASLTRKLRSLEARETRLIDLAADGTLPQAKIRSRLHDLHVERKRLEAGLAVTGAELATGAKTLTDAIGLVAEPRRLYERVDNEVRRLLNETFYQRFYLDEKGVKRDLLNQPFDDFHVAEQRFFANRAEMKTTPTKGIVEYTADGSTFSKELQASLADVFLVPGSSKTVLVGRAGLEPATNGL
jgi:site-specific DNA recombinase